MFSTFLIAAAQVSLSANNYQIDERMPSHSPILAWSDEFDGKSLDRGKWTFDTSRNKLGWYNGELQYYAADRPQNLRIDNGGIQQHCIQPQVSRERPQGFLVRMGHLYPGRKRPQHRLKLFQNALVARRN